jgi:hypothetical protein
MVPWSQRFSSELSVRKAERSAEQGEREDEARTYRSLITH